MLALFLISGRGNRLKSGKTQTKLLIPRCASGSKHWTGYRVDYMPRSWCQVCWKHVHFRLWSTLPELETQRHSSWWSQLLSEPPERCSWCVVLHNQLLCTMGVLWGMIDNDVCWWLWWYIVRAPSVTRQLMKHQLSLHIVQVGLSLLFDAIPSYFGPNPKCKWGDFNILSLLVQFCLRNCQIQILF